MWRPIFQKYYLKPPSVEICAPSEIGFFINTLFNNVFLKLQCHCLLTVNLNQGSLACIFVNPRHFINVQSIV